MPRLVCLAYMRGFYFLFCCVEASSVVLSVVLRCVVIHYVVLHCVAIHCVVSVLLPCIVLQSIVLLLCCIFCVVLRCLVLCNVVDKFSISSIWSMLKLYIRHTQPTSLTGRQSLHLRTRQTQHHSLTLRQYEPHYATNLTNSITLTHWQTKSPHLNTTRQTKRPLPNRQT